MLRHYFIRPLLSAVCIVSMLMMSTQAFARSESEIKAFYLYNFIKFIDWPDDSDSGSSLSGSSRSDKDESDIAICVIGDNPFSAYTEKLNSLKAKNRGIKLINLDGDSVSDCSVLFVSASEEHFYADLLQTLGTQPILTVSDIDNFIDHGGMIGFIKAGNVVRFNVNLKQAREVGLSVSAKLLKLANKVEQ